MAKQYFLLSLGITLTTLRFCAGSEAPSRQNLPEQVVAVFKTHFDIGYTDFASNVVQRYRTTMIDDALQVVDQSKTEPAERQFTWTLPGWPLTKILENWSGQTPDRKKRVLDAVKARRFVVHALPFTTHTELLEPEDLVRGLEFSSDLARSAALELPRDAKMTDVPCHSWVMPTVLKHAGVNFLHLGCNAASSSPKVPRLFWWEGPDGSRLLTMYTAESYGTGLTPPPDWPYKTWLALIHTGDNHGPPTPAEVEKLMAEAAQKLPGVKIRIGRLSDFSDAILKENRPIPVVRGDMPDTWIHGPMCDPQGAKLARSTRPELGSLECLSALLPPAASEVPASATTALLRTAREQSLLYGEHTWGGAQSWVTQYGAGTKWTYDEAWKAERSAGRFNRLEGSWAEHSSYIQKASSMVADLRERELQTLATSVKFSLPRCVVFNPLPWLRSGPVTVAVPWSSSTRIAPAGQRIALPAVNDKNQITFPARNIPSLGYMTFQTFAGGPESGVSSNKKSKLPDNVLENPHVRITLDPARGCIQSVILKKSGRELVNASADHGFGQYLYQRFDSNQVASYVRNYVKIDADWAVNELGKPKMIPAALRPRRSATPVNTSVETRRNAIFSSATMRMSANAELPHGVETRVLLYQTEPWFDIETTVLEKPADPWPEAGWVCLPFNVGEPRFRIGRQNSIIDPSKDIVAGANFDLMAANNGVAVFDAQGRGAGMCAIDSPLVSLGEPGCWKYSGKWTERRADVFVNLFNNQWTTNFRFWNEGTWTSRIRIWAFESYEPDSALIRPALEARFPVEGVWTDAAGGQLPVRAAGIAFDRDGLLVTALTPAPEGRGTLLRFWEMTGKTGPCRITLPETMQASAIRPVDLRGQPLGPATKISHGHFDWSVKAFAPASFVLE